MNRPTKLLLGAAFAAFAALPGRAGADAQQMQELVPDAARPRKTERTHVFSRTQLIYSPGESNYLHHWVDRPLFVDPTLDDGKPEAALMSLPSYRMMQETALRYGLDGFSFFPQTSRRSPFYAYVRQSNLPDFQLLSEFVAGDQDATKPEVLKMALDTPASFRLDGKLVITSYRADGKTPEYWQDEIAKLKAQYGDTFLFLPDLIFFAGQSPSHWQDKFHQNTVTARDVADIKEYLRKWARATDGLYSAYAAGMINDRRTFDTAFYRDFVIRLMKSVLAEPEFKDKYFGLSAVVGHENCTRFGYTLSSDATKTLRHSFEAAMSAQPDLINIPEWDEQNENTSLRPTVYNGLSSLRIMRYYTAKLRGQKLTPLPGDNLRVPNLILSYRKLLTLGEKLEIELLNVPDAEPSTPYTARLTLEDANGKTVHAFAPQSFTGDAMEDRTLVIPGETLAEYPAVRPKLAIEMNGRTQTFADGLHYIHLRPTWNWDYKWVKQPLRDLLQPEQVKFEVSTPAADGTRTVRANLVANEPLMYVEVLDDDDVVYSYSPNDDWRENADQVIVRLQWQAFGGRGSGLKMKGTVALQNATARWLVPQSYYAPVLQGQTLLFDGKVASMWRDRVLLAVPRDAIDKAAFAVNLPGIFQGEVPLKVLMEKTVYGVPGPKGFNLVFSRYLSQDQMPPNVNAKAVAFEVPLRPDSPNSVLHLQAIGKSGRIYRSRPVVLNSAPAAPETVTVYSETTGQAATVQVSGDRVPDIRYQFDPARGSALVTDAGRPFWGILGGYFAQVTGRGGGNAGDDTPFISGRGFPQNATKTAPDRVKTADGEYSLRFDGQSTYLSLPQGVIPRRAAFTIEMEIKPDGSAGKQVIIANRSYYPGSFTFYTQDGVLKADFLGENMSREGLDSELVLPAGKWSRLTIRYDQQTLRFSVDGKSGKALPVSGPGLYDTASVVGGYGTDWFKGEIKSLRIRHEAAK